MMLKLPYDTVVFDLDGTLFEAGEGITSSVRYAMDMMGYEIPEGVDLNEVVGPPLRDSFTKLLHVPEEKAQEAMDLYRKHFQTVGMFRYSVYPRIRQMLQVLRDNDVYVAMATSKPYWLAMKVMKYFRLDALFNVIIGEDGQQAAPGKPQLVKRALPEGYKRAAMVGDRKFDVQGALANGIDAIGAGYGYGSREELLNAGATHYVASTQELYKLLCGDAPLPRGYFLSVQGGDGSGKSTQIRKLTESLKQFGYDVLNTREPGGCAISEKIREVILDINNSEMCDVCQALLYAASRAQHVHQVIRPRVESGKLVLCDRFVDSSVAYQGGARNLGIQLVQQINKPAVDDMMPDITVYLAIDAEVAIARRYSASQPDRLEVEGLGFQKKVQAAYERMIREDPARFVVVDASRSIEEIAEDTLNGVLDRLQ